MNRRTRQNKCVRSPDGGRIVGRAKKNAFDPLTAEELFEKFISTLFLSQPTAKES
jgi:hypothetical protein